jgi:hypothetical protein
MEVTMNTKLSYIGRALHAVCLLLCSHMAQSAVVATKCVAHASAYTVHEPHIQVPQQLNGDEAKTVTAQVGFRFSQSLPSANAFNTARYLNSMHGETPSIVSVHNLLANGTATILMVGVAELIEINGVE